MCCVQTPGSHARHPEILGAAPPVDAASTAGALRAFSTAGGCSRGGDCAGLATSKSALSCGSTTTSSCGGSALVSAGGRSLCAWFAAAAASVWLVAATGLALGSDGGGALRGLGASCCGAAGASSSDVGGGLRGIGWLGAAFQGNSCAGAALIVNLKSHASLLHGNHYLNTCNY